MKIAVKKEKRKSIAYCLAPHELTIKLPEDSTFQRSLSKTYVQLDGEKLSKKEFEKLITHWVNKLQVNPRKVQVKKIKNKWASCSSKGVVLFNSNLASMPQEFVEYVVCHELLHLKVLKHNKLFNSLLTAYIPDWQQRIENTIEFLLN